MAKVGLSKPYFAKYNYDEELGLVSYSDGGLLGKYTEMSIELSSSEDNDLYGDDGPAESDKTFSGGLVNVTTDDLLVEIMLSILGLKSEVVTYDDITTEDAQWVVFDDDQETPYIGLGGIIKRKLNGKFRWFGYVLDKIQFANPGLAAVTQGKNIEWQTSSLSATILRSDSEKHPWFRISSDFSSPAEAEKIVKNYLNIS